MKFTVLLWITFALLTGCAQSPYSPCPVLKQSLEAKMKAIDLCVATGLCAPSLADVEQVYRLGNRVRAECEVEE